LSRVCRGYVEGMSRCCRGVVKFFVKDVEAGAQVIYFTLSSPGFAPCGANVSTSPPSCRPRGKSSVDGHMQHMIEIPAACAHCSCCNITFRRPESFCAKAAELEHTNMHRQRVHAHRLCLRTLLTTCSMCLSWSIACNLAMALESCGGA
jgi:hypothetical protein